MWGMFKFFFLFFFRPGSINAATAVTVDMTQTNANDIETALRNNGTVIDVNTVSNPTGISK